MPVVGAVFLLAINRALAQIRVEHDDPRRSALQPIAIAADRDDVTVMKQAVENGRRDHRVGEHTPPLPIEQLLVIGMQPPRSAAKRTKKQMRCIRLKRPIAELVDNEQPGFAEVGEAIFEPAAIVPIRARQRPPPDRRETLQNR